MGFSRLRLCVLGRLEVWHDDQLAPLPASKKTRALLAYLVVTGRAHTRQRLCEMLWDGPDDPRAALRWSLWKVRPLVDHLRTQRLVATRDSVAFESHGADIDLVRLRSALSQGLDKPETEALARAASLMRGELLEGLELDDCFRFHQWCVAERESLRAAHASVLSALVARHADRPEQAVAYARALLDLDPLTEASHISLIELLVSLGRSQDALEQYEACRRILERELHARPSRALTRLRSRLWRPMPTPGDAPQPPANSNGTRRGLPLVGRDFELAAIERVLAETAARSETSVLLFTGEPGIGKTRLLEALLGRAERSGFDVLRARAYEAEMRRPYGPLLDAFSAANLGIVAAEADRSAFWAGIVARLTQLSAERPLVLLLDDIHWLDEDSAAFVHHLVRTGKGLRILLVVAARSGELADNLPCLRVIRALSRDGHLETLALSPLSADAVSELVRASGPNFDPARIARESQGNPLFAIELLRAQEPNEGVIPSDLEQLIRDRLDQLEPEARQLVPWVATFGHDTPIDVLTEVTGLRAAELAAALDQLERRQVLSAANDNWDFTHDLVRRVAYGRLSSPRRKACHLLLARVLVKFPDPDAARAGEVARHASLGGDAALCAKACVRAGERCLRLFAYRAAESLSELGRNQAERLPAEQRIPLQISLIALVVHPGAKLRAGAELGHELARLATDATNAELDGERSRALVLLARLYYHGFGDTPRARAALGQAVSLLEKNPTANVEALTSGVRCLALLHADMPRVKRLFESLALLGEQVEDSLYYQWGIGLVHRWEGATSLARSALARAVAHARARADHWAEFECAAALIMLELESRNELAARALSADLLATAERLDQAGSEYAFASALGALANDDGAALARAHAELDRLDAPALAAYVGSSAAARSLARNEHGAARLLALRALESAIRSTQPLELARAHAVLGVILRADGKAGEAEAAFTTARALGPDLPADVRAMVSVD